MNIDMPTIIRHAIINFKSYITKSRLIACIIVNLHKSPALSRRSMQKLRMSQGLEQLRKHTTRFTKFQTVHKTN